LTDVASVEEGGPFAAEPEGDPMVLDHVGIAVRSIEQALTRWSELFGYQQATEVVTNTRQKVKVVFLSRNGELPVKLIEPTDPSSPVHGFVQRGGGLHHLCFRCESVDATVARLAAMGVRVLSPPQPGEAFENEKIAFVYAGDGLNVELVDTDRRAGRRIRAPDPGRTAGGDGRPGGA
jgi:methylmalonyl-CoA/ethylmalonyl-CoA epimerase